ncbi:MAG: PAAR domain-containing protein [Phyllobacteriaceae bacterium]|nr:PAAR domain-containing protein [Phyllobacteriaceae bacterium]
MPGFPAARKTDMTACPMVTPGLPPIPHVGGPITMPCSPNVIIGMMPAARVTDIAQCVGPPDVIVKGSRTVFINMLPAARVTDPTAHGGKIITGQMNVLIGDDGGGPAFKMSKPCLKQAAASGAPFVKA